MAEILEKIQRKIGEDNMGIKSRANKDLTIFNLTELEYDKFIKITKEDTETQRGYETIILLLDAYEKIKSCEQIMEYNEELKQKILQLETKIKEFEEKPVLEKKKFIGGE